MPSTLPVVDDRLAEVLVHRVLREVERLQRAPLDEVGHRARLRDRRDVGRVAALDRGREHGGDVVAARGVLDRHVRVLLGEAVDDGLEGLLLVAGPDADHRDRCRRPLSAVVVCCGRRRSARFVVVAAACSDEEQEGEHAVRGGSSAGASCVSFRSRRRCRVPSPGRRSGARACRPRRSIGSPLRGLRAGAEAADHRRVRPPSACCGVPTSAVPASFGSSRTSSVIARRRVDREVAP